MSNILIAVHRAWPFPGGSEYYTMDIAVELKKRGNMVTILAHEHEGDKKGIRITNDYNVLVNERFDLVLVHGGDVITQNIVHANAAIIKSPICYMIIKPSESQVCLHGMKWDDIIAYSTSMDIEHIRKFNHLDKARRIRHGIVVEETIAKPGIFKKRYGIDGKLIVSAGGFYPHKGMIELAEVFTEANLKDTTLCLFGYADGPKPEETHDIKVFQKFDKGTVMEAIADADLYVMNSTEEGFGLVLLEAMMNKTPWIAREIAGASDMKEYGFTYNNKQGLYIFLDGLFNNVKEELSDKIENLIEKAYNFAMSNHTIKQTVNDIEDIINEIS